MTQNTTLSLRQAKQSPCLQCDSACCCQLLILERYPLVTLSDVDKTDFYLNFSDIEIVLDRGELTVYYSKPCRFFDTINRTCTIHNQPEQPAICVHYNPYSCFYKKLYEDKEQIRHGYIWLNRARLDRLCEHMEFDEHRTITKAPDPGEIIKEFNASFPYERDHPTPPASPKAGESSSNASSCRNCSALCCKSLLFYTNQPFDEGNLDYCTYSLGFPGVEYLVADHRWAILVDARCNYLDANDQCTVSQKEERPLRCRYLNPLQCDIKRDIKYPNQLRVDYENFPQVKQSVQTDEDGKITSMKMRS